MCAQALRREKRPFEVRAEDARADRLGRNRTERGDEILLRRGDEGRLEGGDAGFEERVACLPVSGKVRAGEVDAAEAVHL